MKNVGLLFVFALLFTAAALSQQNVYRPVKIVTNLQEALYTYDASGRLLSETVSEGNSTTVNSYTYDGSGRLLTHEREYRINGALDEASKITNTYNAGGNIETSLTMLLSGSGWVSQNLKIYLYPFAHTRVVTDMNWNGSEWVYYSRETRVSNSLGTDSIKMVEYRQSNAWVNYSKYIITGDGEYHILSELHQRWQDNAWVNDYRSVYDYYIHANSVLITDQKWVNNNWQPVSRLLRSYMAGIWETEYQVWKGAWEDSAYSVNMRIADGDNAKRIEHDLLWVGGTMIDLQKRVSVMDKSGNYLRQDYYAGNDLQPADTRLVIRFNREKDSLVVFGSWADVTYDIVTGIGERAAAEMIYSLEPNYPNPFNASAKIRYTLAGEGSVKLTVYNSLGETVTVLRNEVQPAGRYEVSFDGTGLTSGIYYCELSAGSFRQVQKMILLK